LNCAYHPDRQAIGQCVECGRAVCTECKLVVDGKVYCNSCIEKKMGCALPIRYAAAPVQTENTSGMGSGAAVPAGLGEFNWGAFFLTWIWGIGNNVWWSFLSFVPYLGWMVMPWILAFKGNEWAWQSKRWESVEHFKSIQHTWAVWGWAISIAITAFIVLLMIGGAVLLLWALQRSGGRGY